MPTMRLVFAVRSKFLWWRRGRSADAALEASSSFSCKRNGFHIWILPDAGLQSFVGWAKAFTCVNKQKGTELTVPVPIRLPDAWVGGEMHPIVILSSHRTRNFNLLLVLCRRRHLCFRSGSGRLLNFPDYAHFYASDWQR